jgi:protoporphyrinogen oxidase
MVNRRAFLHGTMMASMMAALPKPSQAFFRNMQRAGRPFQNPISQADGVESIDFNGDDISRPHDMLWNKTGYIASKGGIPREIEELPLVVVGGGVAGLSAAYFLRDLKPTLLEGAPTFGGNSKGEKFGNSTYSIGAAYLVKPDEGSDVEAFLQELNLDSQLREEHGDDMTVQYNGQIQRPFWEGATAPGSAIQFQKVQQTFRRILEEKYPDIPRFDGSSISDEEFNRWDSMTFEQWLRTEFGTLHPHVEEYLQLYSWSSFCGSLDEISAAQMLNFVTSETESILALPGGNAAITEKVYTKLEDELGPQNLRGGCMVLDIAPVGDGVRIVYEDGQGVLKAIQTKACIFAGPKFVAGKLIDNMPTEQRRAIESIKYRAYIVANLLLKEKIQSPTYELYCLKGVVPERPMAMSPSDRKFTDICFGSWAAEPNAERGIVTVYKALPYDGARQFLFSPFAHQKNRNQVMSQIPEVLAALGLDESAIDGVRMTRWGHALPLAEVGGLSSGMADRASESLADGRIVFANQDNWLNPSFECAFAAAQEAAVRIRSVLGS